ncbi:Purple acid phosphatase 15 [Chlorella sorokiniana]|uniref:Purple acid phosphatase n=1 Tax=Chlorella sorokiniana TaxID=3076 RepID=A0A2P6U1G3_CHLSO|nr:Purple acid phosphatase 15 [Chlorella sorokiniana]|eukprot:PRW60148.1 Purple acid phosphatase 15 [Chlorella sorokiniana]
MAGENDENNEPQKPQTREAGETAAAMDKVTDMSEESEMKRGVDKSKVQQAMMKLAAEQRERQEAQRQREKELAAVKVAKEDVDLIAQQFDLDKKKAERCLREAKGDVKAALRALLAASYAARRQAWRQRIDAIKAKQASRRDAGGSDAAAAPAAGAGPGSHRVFSKHVAIPVGHGGVGSGRAGSTAGSQHGTPYGSPKRHEPLLDAAGAALPQLELPAIWLGYQTAEPLADLAAASGDQLRRFLQQAGWPAEAAAALPDQDVLAAAVRSARGAWEVERVIVACTWPEEVLRVPRKCTDAAVLKAAYRRVSMAVHPDKCSAEGASDAMSIVADCYATLLAAANDGRAAKAVPAFMRTAHSSRSLHASGSAANLAGTAAAGGASAAAQQVQQVQQAQQAQQAAQLERRQTTEGQPQGQASPALPPHPPAWHSRHASAESFFTEGAAAAAPWLDYSGQQQGQQAGQAWVEPNGTQTTNPIDPALSLAVQDLPLDKPPLARTAVGWEPEGVHLTLWGSDSVLVSWQTGAGGMTYHSPILHHVLVTGLQPGQRYWYRVGGQLANGTAAPESREWSFRLPAGPPAELRIGVLGDPGQTYNTSRTLRQLADSKPDVVFVLGDLSYADLYYSNQTDGKWSYPAVPTSQQLRWDAWARLSEPLLATVPAVFVPGNHELEILRMPPDYSWKATFTAFNARYPGPQDPAAINTRPNNASQYLNGSNPRQFINSTDYQPQNGFWSVALPWATVLVLNSYLPYGPTSQQHRWAAAQLAAVNRTSTPWLLVLMHGAPRTTFVPSFQVLEEFMSFFEPLFYRAQVDLVLSGHVHSYERSLPMYNYSVDPCGVQYITVGDGGNVEGPERRLIDVEPPPYCSNPSLFEQPVQQATTSGEPTLTIRDGRLCPEAQPAYSAFRDPSFGHGLLVLRNDSTAEWSWRRNEGKTAAAADSVVLHRTAGCGQRQAAAGEPQAQPGAASGGSSSRGGPGPGVLALVAAAAAAAALQDA